MNIIIRTFKNAVVDTSKQRVIEACCDKQQIQAERTGTLRIRIRCVNCNEAIADIIS